MLNRESTIDNRLKSLETHLAQENPVLLESVQGFRSLDRIAQRMKLLGDDESFATQIPWWPLISILGTFSAGKSTFINHYLGQTLQRSGNQAVDDKFTVICYSNEQTPHALPGIALDSDPRFPFYKISSDIEEVASGEGDRIDAYLQLKSCKSDPLRGKIIIDSPGFDADAQRTSTLRITNHIIDLSDLVIVFFDARHPEPGAMRDTLNHLVSDTIHRNDSGKFLYVLNQIDTTAREDNPEEVIAAWQRALGEHGLTAGRFYTTYNPEAAVPIEDAALRTRFESKRDRDIGEIHGRMAQVEIERAYRIVASLEKTARDLESRVVPILREAITKWKNRVLIADGIIAALITGGLLVNSFSPGNGIIGGLMNWMGGAVDRQIMVLLGTLAIAAGIHFGIRTLASKSLTSWVRKTTEEQQVQLNVVSAFLHSTRPWRSIFAQQPAGWGKRSQRKLQGVIQATDTYVQKLNDRFTNPSGGGLGSAENVTKLGDVVDLQSK
ncbi:MAG: dynamin family protein [bacterium]